MRSQRRMAQRALFSPPWLSRWYSAAMWTFFA